MTTAIRRCLMVLPIAVIFCFVIAHVTLNRLYFSMHPQKAGVAQVDVIEVDVSAHDIQKKRVTGPWQWRFFQWGLLHGQSVDGDDEDTVTIALSLKNPTPFMVFLWSLLIAGVAWRPQRPKFSRAMATLAMVLLLGAMTARPFLADLPFRSSPVRFSITPDRAPQAAVSRNDLSRAVFPILLLAAVAIWLVGWAAGGPALRHGWLAVLMLAFAAWSAATIPWAGDRRGAVMTWMEQVSLMAAALLAAQLFTDRRRWNLLLAVLLAVGMTLAIKGFYQSMIEAPERIADFAANGERRLAEIGAVAGSPQAIAFEARLKDPAPFGYFSLANPFASLMLLLTASAVGVTVDRLQRAIASWRAHRASQRKGELHMPLVYAAADSLCVVMLAAVLAMTRSRGALAAAAVVIVAGAIVAACRKTLAKHWTKAVAAAVLLVAAGVVAVGGYGMRHDGLPSKSLTVRWFYWTAAAEVVRENPVVGVGPGNFGPAYLLHRRACAEEAVKTPHDVLLNSLAQYGVGGGLLFLAVLGGVLLAACRPGPMSPVAQEGGGVRFNIIAGLAAVGSVLAARTALSDWGGEEALLVVDILVPVAVLAMMMALSLWACGCLSAGSDSPATAPQTGAARFIVVCGLVAFALHNLLEDSLAMPGAAMVFWTLAGAAVAGAGGPVSAGRSSGRLAGSLRGLLAAAAVVAVVAAAGGALRPVWAKTALSEQAAAELDRGRLPQAAALGQAAGRADPLDGVAAIDAGRFVLFGCPHGSSIPHNCLIEAYEWGRQAVGRNPKEPSHYRFAAAGGWYALVEDSRQFEWRQPPTDANAAAAEMRAKLDSLWNNKAALARLSYCEFLRGQYAEAMRIAGRAATLDEKSATLAAQLGDAAAAGGQNALAHDAWRRAADLAPQAAKSAEALALMSEAVRLDPMDSRLHVEYARMLCAANRSRECLDQLAAAGRIHDALTAFGLFHPPPSAELLTVDELREIDLLRQRAEFLIHEAK